MRFTSIAIAAAVLCAPLAGAAQDPPPVVRRVALTPDLNQAFEHEQRVWNAVKANDVAAFNRLVAGPFTYIDPNGILAPWTAEHSEALKACTTNSFTSDDVQAQEPVAGLVILSFRATIDQTCNGQKSPSPLYILSVWQRAGSSWKLVAHSETAAAPAR
jgi:ketosteroid isomerase-like protein